MKKILHFIGCLLVSQATITAQPVFTGKPQYKIVTLQSGDTLGTTIVELFPNIAPLHVANFDSLVAQHFYDSTAFHRVIPGFMIQGGDPNSRHGPIATWGYGDPSQPTVNAEFSAAKHVRGILSAARDADTNSANSQFFICVANASWLNGQYSVYGKVVSGMNYVDSIVSAPRDTNDNPLDKIEMFISYVGSNDSVPEAPLLNLPASGSYASSTTKVLKWFNSPGAIVYNLELATDSLFNNMIKNVEVGTNSYTAPGLTPQTKYFWRVRANNGGHFSTYSEVWNFYVSGVGLEELNNSFSVKISSNPNQGVFTIEQLQTGSIIDFYDISGKLIFHKKTTTNKELIDITTQGKGVYLYTIRFIDGSAEKGKIVVE